MTDLTLEQLAAQGGEQAAQQAGQQAAQQAAEAAAEESTGEWLVSLYDRLRDDNLVMPLLFGPETAPGQQAAALPDAQPADQPEAENLPEPMNANDADETDAQPGEIDADEIDAESIAEIMQQIEDKVGDVRISQIRATCESRPEFVNQLLEQHL